MNYVPRVSTVVLAHLFDRDHVERFGDGVERFGDHVDTSDVKRVNSEKVRLGSQSVCSVVRCSPYCFL